MAEMNKEKYAGLDWSKGDMVAGNRPARQSIRVPDPDAGVGCVLLMGLVLIALAIVFLFALLIRAFI